MVPENHPYKGKLEMLHQVIDARFPQNVAAIAKEFVTRFAQCMAPAQEGKGIEIFITLADSAELAAILRSMNAQARVNLQILLGHIVPFDRSLPRLLREAALEPEYPERKDLFGSDADLGYRRASARMQQTLRKPEGRNIHYGAEELVNYCKTFLPRREDDTLLTEEELAERCRFDPEALKFTEGFTDLMLEQSPRAEAFWKNIQYVPRTPGGTQGEGTTLNEQDREDTRLFILYLCEIVRVLSADFANIDPTLKDNDVGNHAQGRVMYEIGERVMLSFLRQRFPAMFRSHQHLDIGERGAVVEKRSKFWADFEREFYQIYQRLQQALNKADHLRSHTVNDFRLITHFLLRFGMELREIALLLQQTELFKRRPGDDLLQLNETLPLVTGPNPNVIQWQKNKKKAEVIAIRACPGATRGIAMKKTFRWTDENQQPAVATCGAFVHGPGTEAGTSPASTVPLSKIFHPEDPIALCANDFGRYSVMSLLEYYQVIDELDIQGLFELGSSTPATALVHFNDHDDNRHYLFFALPRAAAAALNAEDRIRELTDEETDLVQKNISKEIDDPVAIDIPNDDDAEDEEEAFDSSEYPQELLN